MSFITQGKTNIKYLLIVIILALIVAGGTLYLTKKQEISFPPLPEIQPQQQVKDETADWETYINEEYGYEIKYPNEYNNYPSCNIEEINNGIVIGNTFSIEVLDSEGLNLFEYVDKFVNEIKEEVDEISTKDIFLDNTKGTEISYQYGPRYSRTIIVLKDNKIYQISFDAGMTCSEELITKDIPSELEVFEQLPSTFRFIDETANWKTYINTSYGYQLKYPQTLSSRIPENAPQVFIVYFADKGEYLEVEISGISSLGVNKEIEFDMQRANPTKTNFLNKPALSIRPARNIYPGEPFRALIIYLEDKKFKIELGYYGDGRNEALFEQILSTFNFLD